jgi:hypothetical protein
MLELLIQLCKFAVNTELQYVTFIPMVIPHAIYCDFIYWPGQIQYIVWSTSVYRRVFECRHSAMYAGVG